MLSTSYNTNASAISIQTSLDIYIFLKLTLYKVQSFIYYRSKLAKINFKTKKLEASPDYCKIQRTNMIRLFSDFFFMCLPKEDLRR